MKLALAYTIAAGLLIDATVYTASRASRVHGGTQVLAVLLLGTAGLVAVLAAAGYGFGAAWRAGSAAVYGRRLAREQQPVTCICSATHELSSIFDEYWAETRKAVAEADCRAYTAVHAAPLPPTLPMPVVDLAAWGRHEVRDAA